MSNNLNFLSALGKSKKGSPSLEGPASNSHPENFLLSQVLWWRAINQHLVGWIQEVQNQSQEKSKLQASRVGYRSLWGGVCGGRHKKKHRICSFCSPEI